MKKLLALGVMAGLVSAVACIGYDRAYFFALQADFSAVVNPAGLVASNLLGCLLASVGYYVLCTRLKMADKWLLVIFTGLTFASLVGPLSAQLPLTIEAPELFPGLTVPMHFFPQLIWSTLKPFFKPGTTGQSY